MHPILRNILAVIAAFILGNLLNMGLIMLGHTLIPPPEGMIPMDWESLIEYLPKFETKHFIFPFLAHALGTLAAAFLVAKLAATRKMTFAWGFGIFFLLIGIYNAYILPGPMWFDILDVVAAYIPMAWLGGKWGTGKT